MADDTVYPEMDSQQSPSDPRPPKLEPNKSQQKTIFSLALILDNPLFSIDLLLLIRISSFLDMLSATRFASSWLKLSRFFKRNIQLQSVVQSHTNYLIDQFGDSDSFHILCPLLSPNPCTVSLWYFHSKIYPMNCWCNALFQRMTCPLPQKTRWFRFTASSYTDSRIAINMITSCCSRQRTMCSEPFSISTDSISALFRRTKTI